MINDLLIMNFKSIKDLSIKCRRINLFIGKPNTGKSNILEALSLLSWFGNQKVQLGEYVRFQDMSDLFYDELTDDPIEMIMATENTGVNVRVEFRNEVCRASFTESIKDVEYDGSQDFDYSGKYLGGTGRVPDFNFIKSYKFRRREEFPEEFSSFLMPPYGSNLFSVVKGNRKLRTSMARFFNGFGFRLVLRRQDKTFEFQKRIEDEDIDLVSQYPYVLASDTLQRMVFYTIAIESNENSSLIFEEPESHAFPYYTKYLGEKIAFDKSNQYFIATHNPYLLLSILEKADKNDVNVLVTYFQDYETKVKCLAEEAISDLMSYDPFANLDVFIDHREEKQ